MTTDKQAPGQAPGQAPAQSARAGDDTLVDPISGRPIDPATGTTTTGHEWDGIRELDTPMPRWWLWTFYATIVWALVYFVLYPAIPLATQATAGVLGYSSRCAVEDEINRVGSAARKSIPASLPPVWKTSSRTDSFTRLQFAAGSPPSSLSACSATVPVRRALSAIRI